MSVTASSQSSRFAEADVGIDLKNVNIAVGGRDLLKDAQVKLVTGSKYGLIGRNGVGKSILLTCIANGSLLSPALRESMRIMYIHQTLDAAHESKSGGLAGRDAISVCRELLRQPYGTGTAEQRELSEKERLMLQVEQQSGARGHLARQRLLAVEAAERSLEQMSLTDDGGIQIDDEGTRTVSNLDQELAALEVDPKEFHRVLKSMKIKPDMLGKPLGTLSGGWRMRIALAKALLYPPDLLLLDEPTNHLDIAGIAWLECCIRDKFEDATVVFVSHNRSFLNSVADDIILFKNQKLEYFTGNYEQYLQTIEEKAAFADRMQESLDRKRAHMEASIEQTQRLARRQNDDKRLKQVASRKTKLEERVGYERNAQGHRFKLNRDRIGWHDSVRGEVEGIEDEKFQGRLRFTIPQPELPRFNGPLLVIDDLSFERRQGSTVQFRLDKISFCAEAGQRIALLGPNGQGKSTILNLIHETWAPMRGSIQRRTSRIGYFQQHIVVELGHDDRPALKRLGDVYADAKEAILWKHLGSFGLGSQQMATKTPLAALSGGQRVAYAFAELTYQAPSLLLLDEPNSHLDLEALQALSESLADFSGAIVFVSHDLSFVQEVATDYIWVADGRATKLEDGIDEVERRLQIIK